MATIKNLTPHTVSVIAEDGNTIATFPSEGNARATQEQVKIGDLDGIENNFLYSYISLSSQS